MVEVELDLFNKLGPTTCSMVTGIVPLIYQNCAPSISLVLWRGPQAKRRENCTWPVFKWPCYQSQSYGAREHITWFLSLITCHATREMFDLAFLSCFLGVFMNSLLVCLCVPNFPNAKKKSHLITLCCFVSAPRVGRILWFASGPPTPDLSPTRPN